MRRVGDNRNPVKDKFGAGKNGFGPGNPQTGQPATTPGYELFDSWQEEMAGVVEGAGFALKPDQNNQLLQAIKNLAWGNTSTRPTTLAGYGITDAATTSHNHRLVDLEGADAPEFAAVSVRKNIPFGASTDAGFLAIRVNADAVNIGATCGFYWTMFGGENGHGIRLNATRRKSGSEAEWFSSPLEVAKDGTVTIPKLRLADDLKPPPGMIGYFAMSKPPAGWLLCDGSNNVSRSTYAALFAAIGTIYGAGDGVTTFNVPDLRGEFIRGLDLGRGIDPIPNRSIGSIQSSELQSHSHSLTLIGRSGNRAGAVPAPGWGNDDADGGLQTAITTAAGGVETRPRNVALLACIKI